ncbi:acetoacetate decarboxylase [Mycolicibacterium madagascariense]|uniref:Acetoacetate decarboxylase n=1 Tax=Mycolicibacterium madagascariense TaxID=212765 RepID=A0A7I7X995_9MYCO|nr:acetoacetate decarboxylase family protein [Mycolicibacterium madagascariense]MCV7013436.1 acetoacetate decarboxylase family protein [Mycolicibacterium madagascariense]BBZ25845.1 acetoacetate decarboxylase [Mycolicibacterium madagascariense]
MDTNPMIAETVEVDLGGRAVAVPKGGLYDRYRMDTDLATVAADPRVRGVDFFRALPKTQVQSAIGPTRTPNFYYAMSKAQLTYLAPIAALRSRLPGGLDPLQIVPGVGLFSVVFFRYDVCDIDFYTEATVGIAVRPARHGRLGAADLLASLGNDSMHAYVLSLPVNTEIAHIRGHDGYGFPKWVTEIDVDIDQRRTTATVANDEGGTDIAIDVATPKQKQVPSGTRVSTLTSYTEFNGGWNATLSQTNVLAEGSKLLPGLASLTLGSGRLSDDVRSLRPIRALRLDVVTECQNALHIPVPVSFPAK